MTKWVTPNAMRSYTSYCKPSLYINSDMDKNQSIILCTDFFINVNSLYVSLQELIRLNIYVMVSSYKLSEKNILTKRSTFSDGRLKNPQHEDEVL